MFFAFRKISVLYNPNVISIPEDIGIVLLRLPPDNVQQQHELKRSSLNPTLYFTSSSPKGVDWHRIL